MAVRHWWVSQLSIMVKSFLNRNKIWGLQNHFNVSWSDSCVRYLEYTIFVKRMKVWRCLTLYFWEEICSLSNFFCSSYLDMSLKKTFFTKICARPSLQSLFSLNSFFSFLYFWLLNRNCFLRKSRDKLISIKRHCLNCQTQNFTTSNLIITFGLCHNILLGK